MVGGAAMFPSKNIIQNAVNSKDHTTLVAAVKAAGLVETLEGKGPFTVFAPTNAAFGKLPAGTVDNLVKPENKATLTKILTYHVVAGKLDAADLTDGKKLKTVEGEELTVKKSRRQDLDHRRQGRPVDGVDHQRPSVQRRHPCGRYRADAGFVSGAPTGILISRTGMRDGEPGKPGSLFCEWRWPEVSTRRRSGSNETAVRAYIGSRRFERGSSDVEPGSRRGLCEAGTGQGDPAGLGARHALGQCGRHDPDDHVGLADL